MQFKIQNYRGILEADIELEKITLIGGLNHTGKTSIGQAIGAVLTGQTIPMSIPKNQASLLVRNGTPAGSVNLIDGENTAKITWPTAKYSTKGSPPVVLPMAAGLESILDMDGTKRSKALIEILGANPSRSELEAHLKENGITFTIDKLWETIDIQGWDVAYEHAKQTGARLKGSWEQVTGENYGSQKAATWLPDGLNTGTEPELVQAVTVAKKALEEAIAQQAISTSKAVDRNKLPELEEKRKGLSEEKEQLRKDIDATTKILSGLPLLPNSSTLTCPYCKKPIAVQDGKVVKSQILTKEAIAKIREDREVSSKALDDLHARSQQIGTNISSIDAEISAITNMQQPSESGSISDNSVDDCRTKLKDAEAALKAFTAKTEATKIAGNITINQTIVAALAPTGLRKSKLSQCLGEFQVKLTEICQSGGWEPITITPDIAVNYNGHPLILCSQSENYFTRIAIQMALSDNNIIIIDGADVIIDKSLRNGLFNTLMQYAQKVLICMSFASRDSMPNLSSIGGMSYWLQDGKAIRV